MNESLYQSAIDDFVLLIMKIEKKYANGQEQPGGNNAVPDTDKKPSETLG